MIRMAALAAVVALAGCNDRYGPAKAYEPPSVPSEGDARHVSTFHDPKHGVTCWLYGPNNGGISCLPDWMLQRVEVSP